MRNAVRAVQGLFIAILIAQTSACLVAEPREGYYDREHSRYYHERHWHDCGERDEHCRY